ncbi:hypothetical protein RF11_02822 [Thelohanellus kitauei]|uniref:Uncharacterized protein n=1 Tax=Thelohanellus kitauei TaxID=669202 RepID=A0A0C2MB09_THEKT|nr:hypothetical protein RF11_02822 [Thelohanellus kitauei]
MVTFQSRVNPKKISEEAIEELKCLCNKVAIGDLTTQMVWIADFIKRVILHHAPPKATAVNQRQSTTLEKFTIKHSKDEYKVDKNDDSSDNDAEQTIFEHFNKNS